MPIQRSVERFLTTHTGSLPRPSDLIRMMFAKEEGVPVDAAALGARIRDAVAASVRKQVDAGVAIVNDEIGRASCRERAETAGPRVGGHAKMWREYVCS